MKKLFLFYVTSALSLLLHRSKSTMLFREHYNHLSKLRYNIPCKVRAELNWCNAIWTFQTNTKLLFIVWLSAISYFHAGLIQTINNKQFQHQLLFVTSQAAAGGNLDWGTALHTTDNWAQAKAKHSILYYAFNSLI